MLEVKVLQMHSTNQDECLWNALISEGSRRFFLSPKRDKWCGKPLSSLSFIFHWQKQFDYRIAQLLCVCSCLPSVRRCHTQKCTQKPHISALRVGVEQQPPWTFCEQLFLHCNWTKGTNAAWNFDQSRLIESVGKSNDQAVILANIPSVSKCWPFIMTYPQPTNLRLVFFQPPGSPWPIQST